MDYDEYGVSAEFYDYVVPYRDRQDVTFFVDAAKESGGSVLEIGCGTGRILLPTARVGIKIVGLDISPGMLAVCREQLSREPTEVQANVQLVQAGMRNFELAQSFALVTIPFRPFQHLTTVDDQCACLRNIHRHLVHDGRLVLDLFNPSLPMLVAENLGQEIGDEPEFVMPDGRRVNRRVKFVAKDLLNQVNQSELIYYVIHPDGRTERLVHALSMRYLFRFEAEHLLARCGFQVEQIYADYDKSPYGSKYPGELIFVARKG
jgi:SAM-dependent methyltransferase